MAEDSTAPYTAEDKLQWEVKKLQAETDNLKRRWIHNPASWIAMITAFVALAGVIIQYVKSDNAYQLSEINRKQSELKTAETESYRQQLLGQIKQAGDELSQTQKRREQALADLNSLLNHANELQKRLPSAEAKEIQDTAQRVSNSINELQRVSEQAREAEGSLQVLSTAITENGSSLLAFAVIGSYKERDKALSRAQELTRQGLDYPVEVYQRDPNRYAITLGGYLTHQEASKRVEYAKQQGIASDAYVRLARNWGENLFK